MIQPKIGKFERNDAKLHRIPKYHWIMSYGYTVLKLLFNVFLVNEQEYETKLFIQVRQLLS